MADLKISQLTDGGASQAADEYVVARSGSNFRIDGASVAAAATSVGTLSSLTVSGNTFLATSSGNVGIGAASATRKLSVAASNAQMELKSANTGYSELYFSDAAGDPGYLSYDHNTDTLSVATGGSARLTLNSSGNLAVDTNTLYVDAANNRVGIGTASPGYALDVVGGSATALRISGNSAVTNNTAMRFYGLNAAADLWAIGNAVSTNDATRNFDIYDLVAGANRLRLDASGNLGLGVTPSAWGSSFKSLQVGKAVISTNSDTTAYVGSNWVAESGGDKYIAAGGASVYSQSNGAHIWYNAGTGAAGGSISFTERARIDASGNLGVGATSPSASYRLTVQGVGTAGNPLGGIAFRQGSTDVMLMGNIDLANTTDFELWNPRNGYTRFGTNNTERARITAGGYFKASPNGTYNNATGTYHEFVSTSDNTGTVIVKHTGTSGAQYGITITTVNDQNDATRYFWSGEGAGVERGTLRSNGGLANYSANNVNLASDFRLKKDIAPLASTWDKLKAIEVVNFRYKDCNEGDPALYGVIAQQVQPIVPELVVVTREAVKAKDAELDEDGNEVKPAVEAAPEYYGIREQPMYWLAIKALQEAQARIEALEARLEALEA